MKNKVIKNNYETFGLIAAFHTKHGAAFTTGSRGGKLFADIIEVESQMEEKGAGKLSSEGDYHGGTTAKQSWYDEVREDLTEMRDTAVSISEAEDTPDFEENFRVPRSRSYEALATAARAFLLDGAKHKALFIEFEMPADFLEDLAADLAEFEKADEKQDAGQLGKVSGTADLAELSSLGLSKRKQLQAIVRNKFKSNPGILAEWETAQHIERPSRAKKAAPTG